MSGDFIRRSLEHIREESFQENIVESLTLESDIVQKSHDSVHKFLYIQHLCIPQDSSYHERSAFFTMAWEAFHIAHRSWLDALTGHYNAAYSLLRNVYELVIRGAFFECLTEEEYRVSATHLTVGKRRRGKKSLVEWIDDLVEIDPSIQVDMRKISVAIYDKLEPVFTDREFQREHIVIPSFRRMVQQLIDWEIISISEYIVEHDQIYDILSKNVHVIPDWTDAFRSILADMTFLDVRVNQSELREYMLLLRRVIDLGVVIELNLMRDWISRDSDVQENLSKEIDGLEELGLIEGTKTLLGLLMKS